MSQTSDGKISGFPTNTTLMLFHTLFMDTKKLNCHGQERIHDLVMGGFSGERGARAYIGGLGASPPVVSSSKAPGGV